METDSLFSVNPETGDIEYNSENEVVQDESIENDTVVSVAGSALPDTQETTEDSESVFDSGDNQLVLLNPASAQALLSGGNAVGGTMSSTTIDYFDRIVDGLPSDYGYVAYKTSNDDNYSGSLIYGRDYSVNGNSVVFGKDAVEIALSRYSNGNYNYFLQYDTSDASNISLSLPSSGTLLYYTNLIDGRPTLGRGARPFEIAPYITVALIAVIASLVISRLIKGR